MVDELDDAPASGRADPYGSLPSTRQVTSSAVVLERLYRDELPRLQCFFARSVGRDAAGDLAQEVFVRACASQAFAMAENPLAYLRRIAANLLIDHVRRCRTRNAVCQFVGREDSHFEADQEHALLVEDLDWILTRALGELPRRTRQIFRLNRFEKKSYREIRAELGISLSAVDYHMMKALSRLKFALDEEHQAGGRGADPAHGKFNFI